MEIEELSAALGVMANRAADMIMATTIARGTDWPKDAAAGTTTVSLPDGVSMTIKVEHASWRGDRVRAAFRAKQETANG